MKRVDDPVGIKERANARARELAGVTARRYFEKYHQLNDILVITKRKDASKGLSSFTLKTIDRAAELLQTTPEYLLGIEPVRETQPPDPNRMSLALDLIDEVYRQNIQPSQGRGTLVCRAYELIEGFDRASPGAASTAAGRDWLLKLLLDTFVANPNSGT